MGSSFDNRSGRIVPAWVSEKKFETESSQGSDFKLYEPINETQDKNEQTKLKEKDIQKNTLKETSISSIEMFRKGSDIRKMNVKKELG